MKNIVLLPTEEGFKNIYIISDERILPGDYFWASDCDMIFVADYGDFEYEDCKKIILTNDPQLIKVGIQPIDDGVLAWFIDNPTCEFVDVVDYYEQINQDNQITYGSTNVVKKYLIVIPKQEPIDDPKSNIYCNQDMIEFAEFFFEFGGFPNSIDLLKDWGKKNNGGI